MSAVDPSEGSSSPGDAGEDDEDLLCLLDQIHSRGSRDNLHYEASYTKTYKSMLLSAIKKWNGQDGMLCRGDLPRFIPSGVVWVLVYDSICPREGEYLTEKEFLVLAARALKADGPGRLEAFISDLTEMARRRDKTASPLSWVVNKAAAIGANVTEKAGEKARRIDEQYGISLKAERAAAAVSQKAGKAAKAVGAKAKEIDGKYGIRDQAGRAMDVIVSKASNASAAAHDAWMDSDLKRVAEERLGQTLGHE